MADTILPPVRGNVVRFTDSFMAPRRGYNHLATDFGPQIRGVPGDPIYSSVTGAVVYRGELPTYGKFVVVERDNGDGTYSYFLNAHLNDYADDLRKASKSQDSDTKPGDVIGTMGMSGASAKLKPIPVHGHFEQINTDGKLNFSNGWPVGKGSAGVTDSGVAWERVGQSFELPNGWIANSDNGRISVTLSRARSATAMSDESSLNQSAEGTACAGTAG